MEGIGKEFGLDFSRKYLTGGKIRQMLAKTKKTK